MSRIFPTDPYFTHLTPALTNQLFSDNGANGYNTFADILSSANLYPDLANVLMIRNGGTAAAPVGQALYVSNFYQDVSNYAFGFLDAGVTTGSTLTIGGTGLGTGASQLTNFQIVFNGSSKVDFGITNFGHWTFQSPLRILGYLGVGGVNLKVYAPSSGVVTLYNSLETDFGRLQFGGTSLSFPALKRSGTTLAVRLADDSSDADLTLRACQHNGVTYANRPGTPVAGMVICVTDSTVSTAGSTIAGGGANKVLGWYNGTNWTVVGN